MSNIPLLKAIELCGTQEKLAAEITNLRRHLDGKVVSQQNISYWLTSPLGVPAHYCRNIEVITNHSVSRFELRPDVFGEAPIKGAK